MLHEAANMAKPTAARCRQGANMYCSAGGINMVFNCNVICKDVAVLAQGSASNGAPIVPKSAKPNQKIVLPHAACINGTWPKPVNPDARNDLEC